MNLGRFCRLMLPKKPFKAKKTQKFQFEGIFLLTSHYERVYKAYQNYLNVFNYLIYRNKKMANHKSAKTRINRNNKRSIINGARRSRVRTFVKKVIAAVLENNKEEAAKAFVVAESEMMRAVNKGVFKKNTAARTISRLSKKVKAL